MPYTKNTWTSGDIITKVKLDNIENGIFANSVICTRQDIDLDVTNLTVETVISFEDLAALNDTAAIVVGSFAFNTDENNYFVKQIPLMFVSDENDGEMYVADYLQVLSATTAKYHKIVFGENGNTYTITDIEFVDPQS